MWGGLMWGGGADVGGGLMWGGGLLGRGSTYKNHHSQCKSPIQFL